nr:ribonuclease H-like domain-containing protein [Tanacetum cinerariifolium]
MILRIFASVICLNVTGHSCFWEIKVADPRAGSWVAGAPRPVSFFAFPDVGWLGADCLGLLMESIFVERSCVGSHGWRQLDYQTQKIFLRCDSTGDLYQVTQQPPLQTPVVLLFFSSITWHRRLGHPGDDVLRRLESSNLISCNKSKLPALCHACQIASSTALLERIVALLHSEFAMTDLGSFNCFIGISAQRSLSGMFLSQSKFVEEILERAHMQNCNPCKTPIDTKSKLGSDGDPVSDHTLYRSLAGALQYLTFTRPNLSYDVQQVCLYMHDPRDPYFTALKRILRYIRASSTALLERIVALLHSEFAMTDLGSFNCFIGISAQRSLSGMFLSQSKFVEEILERAHMQNCNPCKTPIDTKSKLGSDGDPVSDHTLYRSLAGALQYLTFTRPNLSYDVQQVCLYMHDPRDPYFTALKRILRYIRGTLDYGL